MVCVEESKEASIVLRLPLRGVIQDPVSKQGLYIPLRGMIYISLRDMIVLIKK